jgi:phytoene dehydrogenase-like protein
MSVYDAIIVGGGHNGLVCAAYLAKAGKRVLLLEASEQLGGAAITRPFAPGFQVSACAHRVHMLSKTLVADLGLARLGLNVGAEPAPTTALGADGTHVTFNGTQVAGVSAADEAAYKNFAERWARFAAHLRPMMQMVPPRLGTLALPDLAKLLRMGLQVRSLGRTEMRELLRVIGMNVYDLVEENFASPLLQGAVAFDAVLGANFGPRSPGSALTLLYRLAAEHGAASMTQMTGGVGAVTQAIAAAARAHGAELRTGVVVEKILLHGDRAAGVRLQGGEEISSARVISNASPRTTFLDLVGAEHLDTGFVRRVTHFRSSGLAAKLHLALSGEPAFTGVTQAALRGRLIVAPSPDYLERAFNATKYDAFSAQPAIEILCPTMTDPSLAPVGKHVLSMVVQYAPYTLRGGWETGRQDFIARIIDTLQAYAPGLRSQIEAAELLTPQDIEREFRIAGGHWHHGELTFDQMFMLRPVPGASQYHTPVPGVFLCGAGAHPGGGVTGLAGQNAAREILRERAA